MLAACPSSCRPSRLWPSNEPRYSPHVLIKHNQKNQQTKTLKKRQVLYLLPCLVCLVLSLPCPALPYPALPCPAWDYSTVLDFCNPSPTLHAGANRDCATVCTASEQCQASAAGAVRCPVTARPCCHAVHLADMQDHKSLVGTAETSHDALPEAVLASSNLL